MVAAERSEEPAQAPQNYIRMDAARVAWVDNLKGLCILLVVMLHSVLGVENAAGEEGWMHIIVQITQPMRMPAFFAASGLFFMRSINAPTRRFIDGKVIHFVYFYALWLTIQFAVKSPQLVAENGVSGAFAQYLYAYIHPFGTLWFIYILPVFFVAARLTRAINTRVMFVVAVALQVLPIHTGILVVDEFATFYIWFFVGYAFSPVFFQIADYCQRNLLAVTLVSALLTVAVWFSTSYNVDLSVLKSWVEPHLAGDGLPLAHVPGMPLIFGFIGIFVLLSISVGLQHVKGAGIINWCGAHSIVIYLSFFFPMAVTRIVLLKIGIISDVGTMSLIVWIAAIVGPAILFWLVVKSGYGDFLFVRPSWARLPASPLRAGVSDA